MLAACSGPAPAHEPPGPGPPGPRALPAAVFHTDLAALLAAREDVETALDVLLATDVAAWTPEARVLLQNDLWGLWQRTRDHHAARSLRTRAAQGAVHLALAPEDLRALDATGAPLPEILPPGAGWVEREAEVPVLSHERAFGLRHLFRILLGGPPGPAGRPRRALTSQLVALDTRGAARLTRVPGELETLHFDGSVLARAEVHELDRGALLRGAAPLRPVPVVRHVPGRGANAFVFELEVPEPLAALPCLRCHDDTQMMSLPTTAYPPGHRFPPLLAQATEEARSLFADASEAARR